MSLPRLYLDLVALSLFSLLPGAGVLVSNDLLTDRIPLEFSSQADRDVCEMACGHGSVMGDYIGNGLFPRPHALKEIAHVTAWGLAFVELGDGVFR